MESLSAYYGYWGDENPTMEEGELIWGKYTEEEWNGMTCAERAEAMPRPESARVEDGYVETREFSTFEI